MTKKIVLVLLDGVSFAQLSYCSFLQSPILYRARLMPGLGYSVGEHPSLWNSQPPSETNKFCLYVRDPEKSQYKKFQKYPVWFRKWFFAISKIPWYFMDRKKLPVWYVRFIDGLPPLNMPSENLGVFAKEGEEFDPKLLSYLQQKKYSLQYTTDQPHHVYKGFVRDFRDWCLTPAMLDVFFAYAPDGTGHLYGPHAEQTIRVLEQIDRRIKKLYEDCESRFGDDFVFCVFSDHGMSEVKKIVNVQQLIAHLDKSRFDVFFDSSMVRFWVHDDLMSEVIVRAMQHEDITFVNEELRSRFGLVGLDVRFGHLFFTLSEGVRVFPDYFNPLKRGVKGTHGCIAGTDEGFGIFVSNKELKTGNVDVLDVAPTVLGMIGEEVPKWMWGKKQCQ